MSPVWSRSRLELLSVVWCLLMLVAAPASGSRFNKQIQCSTCRSVVREISETIESTPEKHMVQVRFRLDEKQHVPYARSEIRLSEIMDGVCKGMKNYYMDITHKAHEIHGREIFRLTSTEISALSVEEDEEEEAPKPAAAGEGATGEGGEGGASAAATTAPASASGEGGEGTAATGEAATPAPAAAAGEGGEAAAPAASTGEGEGEAAKPAPKPKKKKLKPPTKVPVNAKDLSKICEHLIEEYEEELTHMFHRSQHDTHITNKLCVDMTGMCKEPLPVSGDNSAAAAAPVHPEL